MWGAQGSCLLPSRQPLSTFKNHISCLLPSRQPLHCQPSKNIFPARTLSSDNAVKRREHIGWKQVIFQCSSESTNYSSLRMQLCKIWLCNAPIKNIKILQYSIMYYYQARARSARARRACALRALGLLLADGTPTVGGGKTF